MVVASITTESLSVEAFFQIEDLPENAGKILELIDGRLVEKVGSFTPSRIGSLILILMGQYVVLHKLGYITGEAGGYVMSPGNVFNPDVGFISKVRLPQEPRREAPVPPDLAVEVKSPTDSKRALRRKAEAYLESGTRLVWLVFPDEKMVEVYSATEPDVRIVSETESLDGADVIPGFVLPISDIFAQTV